MLISSLKCTSVRDVTIHSKWDENRFKYVTIQISWYVKQYMRYMFWTAATIAFTANPIKLRKNGKRVAANWWFKVHAGFEEALFSFKCRGVLDQASQMSGPCCQTDSAAYSFMLLFTVIGLLQFNSLVKISGDDNTLRWRLHSTSACSLSHQNSAGFHPLCY